MTVKITGGEVSYTRSVQPAPYETKSATITFNVSGDGTDENEVAIKVLGIAADLSLNKVHSMLGIEAPKSVPSAEKPPTDKQKAKEKTKADLAAEALTKAGGAPVDAKGADVVTQQPPTEPAGKTSVVDDAPPQGELTGTAGPVTDATLQEEITKANAATDLKLTPKIKELIHHYAGEGKRSHQIPADKRTAFLKELDDKKAEYLAAASL